MMTGLLALDATDQMVFGYYMILLPATDEATAERFYQPFQGSVIARVEAGRWTLATVLGWLASVAVGTDVVHLAVHER